MHTSANPVKRGTNPCNLITITVNGGGAGARKMHDLKMKRQEVAMLSFM